MIENLIQPLANFKNIWSHQTSHLQLDEARDTSNQFREWMLAKPSVKKFASEKLIRVPYPSRFGYSDTFKFERFSPWVHIVNRVFIVQFDFEGREYTGLLSPSDIDGNGETPFFKNISNSFGPLQSILLPIMAPRIQTVEKALEKHGITPKQVDFISYDHLHTQDIRKWLGTKNHPGLFPNAKLLVMEKEWRSTQHLLPLQKPWYCPHGINGIEENRIIKLKESVMVGDSLALIHTPGHTLGNHSFVTHAGDDLYVTSENGIGPDSYEPKSSKISGLRNYASQSGSEVILNSNTRENSLQQYISMVMEKTIAGPNKNNPNFPNMACSSEMSSYWAFPFLSPTFSQGDILFEQMNDQNQKKNSDSWNHPNLSLNPN